MARSRFQPRMTLSIIVPWGMLFFSEKYSAAWLVLGNFFPKQVTGFTFIPNLYSPRACFGRGSRPAACSGGHPFFRRAVNVFGSMPKCFAASVRLSKNCPCTCTGRFLSVLFPRLVLFMPLYDLRGVISTASFSVQPLCIRLFSRYSGMS